MSKTFAVIYEPGPAWQWEKRMASQSLGGHVKYLLGLHEEDRLLMGGPFSDGSAGLVILQASGIEEANDLIAQDPAITSDVLKARIHEWERIV